MCVCVCDGCVSFCLSFCLCLSLSVYLNVCHWVSCWYILKKIYIINFKNIGSKLLKWHIKQNFRNIVGLPVCLSICIFSIYICNYIWMCAFLCFSFYMCVCENVCMYICVYMWMCVCVCVCVYVFMCVSVYVCMGVCVYVCMCECMYACMCRYFKWGTPCCNEVNPSNWHRNLTFIAFLSLF